MNKRVLVLWSGGIDSTSILKYYLENTDYEIVALKVRYITKNSSKLRILRELAAIKKLMPKLQEIRPFQYEVLNYRIDTHMAGIDVIQFGSLAIYPANSYKCDEIVISFTTDAHTEKYASKQVDKLNEIATIMYGANSNIWGRHPKFIVHPFLNKKREYILNLGDMVSDCWFCRRPYTTKQKMHGCGQCHSCLHVIKSLNTQLIEL